MTLIFFDFPWLSMTVGTLRQWAVAFCVNSGISFMLVNGGEILWESMRHNSLLQCQKGVRTMGMPIHLHPIGIPFIVNLWTLKNSCRVQSTFCSCLVLYIIKFILHLLLMLILMIPAKLQHTSLLYYKYWLSNESTGLHSAHKIESAKEAGLWQAINWPMTGNLASVLLTIFRP